MRLFLPVRPGRRSNVSQAAWIPNNRVGPDRRAAENDGRPYVRHEVHAIDRAPGPAKVAVGICARTEVGRHEDLAACVIFRVGSTANAFRSFAISTQRIE